MITGLSVAFLCVVIMGTVPSLGFRPYALGPSGAYHCLIAEKGTANWRYVREWQCFAYFAARNIFITNIILHMAVGIVLRLWK